MLPPKTEQGHIWPRRDNSHAVNKYAPGGLSKATISLPCASWQWYGLLWLPYNGLNVLCSMAQENRKGVWDVGCVHVDVRVLAAMSSHQRIHFLCL